jgi:hypothetical protein
MEKETGPSNPWNLEFLSATREDNSDDEDSVNSTGS